MTRRRSRYKHVLLRHRALKSISQENPKRRPLHLEWYPSHVALIFPVTCGTSGFGAVECSLCYVCRPLGHCTGPSTSWYARSSLREAGRPQLIYSGNPIQQPTIKYVNHECRCYRHWWILPQSTPNGEKNQVCVVLRWSCALRFHEIPHPYAATSWAITFGYGFDFFGNQRKTWCQSTIMCHLLFVHPTLGHCTDPTASWLLCRSFQNIHKSHAKLQCLYYFDRPQSNVATMYLSLKGVKECSSWSALNGDKIQVSGVLRWTGLFHFNENPNPAATISW